MEPGKEVNEELKAEVNKRFEDLYKEIGPNRSQLSSQVLTSQREIIKDLSKTKADSKKKGAVMAEITKIEKMASRQLPHHLKKPEAIAPEKVKPTKAVAEKPAKKVAAKKAVKKR